MPARLIVGATRGLGASLLKQYAKTDSVVYGTTRSKEGPKDSSFPDTVKWLPEVDLMKEDVGDKIVKSLGDSKSLSTVVSSINTLL
jgi:short-subunit dehydrogenase